MQEPAFWIDDRKMHVIDMSQTDALMSPTRTDCSVPKIRRRPINDSRNDATKIPVHVRQSHFAPESHWQQQLSPLLNIVRHRNDNELLASEWAADFWNADDVVLIGASTSLQDLDAELHRRYREPIEGVFADLFAGRLVWKYQLFGRSANRSIVTAESLDVGNDYLEKQQLPLSEGDWETTKRTMRHMEEVSIEVEYSVMPGSSVRRQPSVKKASPPDETEAGVEEAAGQVPDMVCTPAAVQEHPRLS